MTKQTSFLDSEIPAWQGGGKPPVAAREPPLARTKDPSSSHAAAARHKANGRMCVNRVLCESYVRKWPGCTSKELSQKPGVTLDRYELARRLPETETMLKSVRRVDPGGNKALRWYPVE